MPNTRFKRRAQFSVTCDVHSTRPLHEVATLEETRFNGLKRECDIHEINLGDL